MGLMFWVSFKGPLSPNTPTTHSDVNSPKFAPHSGPSQRCSCSRYRLFYYRRQENFLLGGGGNTPNALSSIETTNGWHHIEYW
ncbi:unnamed protein product [Protopolystoma xenopodis]|uniref:Uncharacterized protein n=1 Tax=Protopolystoma xenopodis TaxID=117903 RepID=A0A448XEP6_9PLAT|nr:unnamed protein product [Protopolystoma xenopodis]